MGGLKKTPNGADFANALVAGDVSAGAGTCSTVLTHCRTDIRLRVVVPLLSLSAGLTACGQPSDYSTVTEARGQTVNAALQPYLDEFMRIFPQPTQAIPLQIGPLEKGVAGKCFLPGGKSGQDEFADSILGDSTSKERRILISERLFAANKENHLAIQNVVFAGEADDTIADDDVELYRS